jgi:hypothetical protein
LTARFTTGALEASGAAGAGAGAGDAEAATGFGET